MKNMEGTTVADILINVYILVPTGSTTLYTCTLARAVTFNQLSLKKFAGSLASIRHGEHHTTLNQMG